MSERRLITADPVVRLRPQVPREAVLPLRSILLHNLLGPIYGSLGPRHQVFLHANVIRRTLTSKV